MTMLRFTDGEATVYLRDGESVTVRGLPYGTEWTVCEQKTPDYSTECGVDTAARAPGNIVSGTLTDNTETIFVNSREYVLPATGSFSAPLYGSIGGGLMLGALFGGWAGRRRKKRR